MLKEGGCIYCGEIRMVEVPEEATVEMINIEATLNCNCYQASQVRKRKKQKEQCIIDIYEVLGECYPEIAELFKRSIEELQSDKIKKLTVNTHGNKIARISMTKDGIKVELEAKKKIERLA